MTKRSRWYIAGVATVIVGIAVALLANHSNTMSSSMESMNMAAVSTSKVNIQNYMFAPMTIKVKVGSTVTWLNQDAVHHSVTADTTAKDAPASQLIGPGQSYSFTFTKTGTYSFHCTPHPYMHGTVIVTN